MATVATTDDLTAGDYIASLPAFVRSIPEERIIFAFIRDKRIAMVIEAEFGQDHAVLAADIARIATREKMHSACILLITENPAASGAIDFADTVTRHLHQHHIPVTTCAHARSVERGAPWTELRTGTTGTVPDPAATWAALSAVVDGHVILISRTDVQARFALLSEPDTDTRARAQREALYPGHTALTLRELSRLIATGTHPGPDVAARVHTLTASPAACIALLGIACIDLSAAAQLYTTLAAHLRGIARAHLLAAAAALYYITGEGIASYEANTHAADAAHHDPTTDRTPYLIHFIATANDRAIPRDEAARALLTPGRFAAAQFGIDVPEYDEQ